jgi:prepilin-type N-terminal cleavage/methylation domain-containing protein
MRGKAFTLIEIMVSLLIFAIGGTIAMSTFTFTASNRIFLDEQTEAYLIASNILQTLILRTQTDPNSVNEADSSSWSSGPSGNWKPSAPIRVRAQPWDTESLPEDYEKPHKMEIFSNSISGKSVYGWKYSVKDAANSQMEINRSQLNHDFTIRTDKEGLNKQLRTLTVAVVWPLSETKEDLRKRVLVSAIIKA